jgi:hypothetical protein
MDVTLAGGDPQESADEAIAATSAQAYTLATVATDDECDASDDQVSPG